MFTSKIRECRPDGPSVLRPRSVTSMSPSQVYYIPAGDVGLNTGGFVPLQASDANSVLTDRYDDYDACDVRTPLAQQWSIDGCSAQRSHLLSAYAAAVRMVSDHPPEISICTPRHPLATCLTEEPSVQFQ